MRCLLGLWILTMVLQGCAAPGDKDSAESMDATAQAPTYVPLQGLSDKERFRQVLYLLEEGEPVSARAELEAYLTALPESDVARDLLAQIDLPADVYFPADYREISLQSGWSLSNVAKHYLGNALQFHALAKYNGIAEPRKLTAGQQLRVPLTATALEVFAAQDAGETPSVEAPLESQPVQPAVAEDHSIVSQDEPLQPAAQSPESAVADVEALHRDALNAYRAQDLDKAIALWDEVLELDPEYDSARLYRSQAVELRKKLSNLL